MYFQFIKARIYVIKKYKINTVSGWLPLLFQTANSVHEIKLMVFLCLYKVSAVNCSYNYELSLEQ